MKQFGRYEVLGEIGAGAMGAVFKAHDPVMDRVVAVKTVHAAALVGPLGDQYRERFTREARAAGRLAHPGIVTVFDAGVEGDTPFLVMEFVPGRSLESILGVEQIPIEKVYEIGQQIAEALGYAHANGVVHRDIKPANIQLTGAPERAKIMDFGVAKLMQAQVTSTGTLLGTPSFMAPEQFTGFAIDGRSDLFSLGVILYWMATGDKPFGGDTITAVSYKIVHTEPIAPRQLNPSVPAALEAVIVKSLAKDPAARYQTGDEMAAALATLRGAVPGASGVRPPLTAPSQSSTPDALSSAVTMPLTASAQLRQSALDAKVAAPKLPTPPSRTVGAAPTAPQPPAPAVPRYTAPAPQPKRSGSKTWLWVVVGVLLAGLLWGGAEKRKRDNAIAEMIAAQTQKELQAALSAAATSASSSVSPDVPATTPPLAPAAASTPAPDAKPATKHATPVAPPPLPDPDISGFPLRLEVKATAPAMVEITADDNPVQMRSLAAGGVLHVGATKIFQVRTDNAGALQLKLNDQDMPELGPVGMPRTVRYTAKNLPSTGSSHRPTAQAQIKVEATNIPRFADLTVSVDGQVVYERAGRLQAGAEDISQIEPVAPGAHTVTVSIGNQKAGKTVKHEVTGDFASAQTRTLRITSHFEGRRAPGMLMFDLSLE